VRRSRSSAAKSDNFLHEGDRRRYIIGAHNAPICPMEDKAPTSPQVTQLLAAWGEGDQVARDQLMSLVYEELVELRFFGGLSIDETAGVLNVSPGTVMRDWTLAKAWLRREISSESSAD
jgi:DNA-directed RNA polymerase specialized sigma24 family protein